MSSGVQRRRRMGSEGAISLETSALYSSSRQQPRQQPRQHRPGKVSKFFEPSGTERTTIAQTRCYTTSCNADAKHKFVHSDCSETTPETTCSSGGGGVCSDDSQNTSDSNTSSSTSRKMNLISLQLQMQALYTVCPYYLDSGDRLINLPDDLIKEVLGRLSVKQIVRMGCLNRSWRSEMQRLITDEQIARALEELDIPSIDRLRLGDSII